MNFKIFIKGGSLHHYTCIHSFFGAARMSLQWILTVSFLFIFFASPLVTRAEVVTCNHNTPVCECTATNANDVCKFTFDIEISLY